MMNIYNGNVILDEQGLYLYPRGYGCPESESPDYLPPPFEMMDSQP